VSICTDEEKSPNGVADLTAVCTGLFMAHNAEEEASKTRICISALHTRKSLALRKPCVVVLLISFSSLSL
jgi:hypothetical protein